MPGLVEPLAQGLGGHAQGQVGDLGVQARQRLRAEGVSLLPTESDTLTAMPSMPSFPSFSEDSLQQESPTTQESTS